MGNDQLAGILQSQWNLLWPLNPAERNRRIEEIRLDYEFENQLSAVASEMARRDEIAPVQPMASTFISAIAITVFVGACGVLMILAATPVPA